VHDLTRTRLFQAWHVSSLRNDATSLLDGPLPDLNPPLRQILLLPSFEPCGLRGPFPPHLAACLFLRLMLLGTFLVVATLAARLVLPRLLKLVASLSVQVAPTPFLPHTELWPII
jgi:hypothetical protein